MQLMSFHYETYPLAIATLMMIICEVMGWTAWRVTIFWCMFAVNTTLIFRFLHGVVNQITDFLGIYCFSITKRRD